MLHFLLSISFVSYTGCVCQKLRYRKTLFLQLSYSLCAVLNYFSFRRTLFYDERKFCNKIHPNRQNSITNDRVDMELIILKFHQIQNKICNRFQFQFSFISFIQPEYALVEQTTLVEYIWSYMLLTVYAASKNRYAFKSIQLQYICTFI